MVQVNQNQRAAARASLHRALKLQPKWREHVEQDAFLREIL
jgi:Tfp pilus assembly protein PilF